MEPNQSRKRDIFISSSEISFDNKWHPAKFSDGAVPFGEFLETSTWSETSTEGHTYGSMIYFRTSSKRRIYSIEPYNILELLGDMGGLLDIIYAFGILCTTSIVYKQFTRSLLKDAY